MKQPKFKEGDRVICPVIRDDAVVTITAVTVRFRDTPEERFLVDVEVAWRDNVITLKGFEEELFSLHQHELF